MFDKATYFSCLHQVKYVLQCYLYSMQGLRLFFYNLNFASFYLETTYWIFRLSSLCCEIEFYPKFLFPSNKFASGSGIAPQCVYVWAYDIVPEFQPVQGDGHQDVVGGGEGEGLQELIVGRGQRSLFSLGESVSTPAN